MNARFSGVTRRIATFVCLWLLAAAPVWAELKVSDDTGRSVFLAKPARRIVSLAPHTTELLFSAGAGERVVATVDYSDYPTAARGIPRVGGSSGLDLERIVALKPDLIVGWASGNPPPTIEQLRRLGLPVYLTEPRQLTDIGRTIVHLGRLAGTETVAQQEADRFAEAERLFAKRYSKRPPLRVFYQVVDPLLVTVNGRHLISEILRLCGGENVFASLPVIAPVVGEEAVLKENPDVIIAGGTEEAWQSWRARWEKRGDLAATRRGAIYFVHADMLHRHSPRILDGASHVCAALDDARGKIRRPSGGASSVK